MKSITFNQALLAVGLFGLTIALVSAEGNAFGIAASLLVDDGPSVGGPVALLVVSFAIPLGTLLVAWRRMGMRLGDDEAGTPLTYAQARLTIGLAGLVLVTAWAPQIITANAAHGWSNVTDSVVYHVISLVILAVILGSALGSMGRSAVAIDRSQALMCLGLITLVIVSAVAPALHAIIVTGAEDDPELFAGGARAAYSVYAIAAVAVTVVILLVLRVRRNLPLGWAFAFAALLVGIAASIHLVYTLVVGVPLVVLVALSYLGNRADSGRAGQVRSGPLLTTLGLLSLMVSASTTKYVIALFHQCADYHASLYLWPTLALVAAVLFSFGLLGAGLWKLRAERQRDRVSESAGA